MTAERLIFKFPRDSNIMYLPFAYFLPEDMFFKLPTVCKIPRKLGAALKDGKTIELINSDQFLNEISDAIALLVFPHLGFSGKFNHYTGYSLVYFVAYQIGLWSQLLEQETGWDLNMIFKLPSTTVIPFPDPDYVKDTMVHIVKRGLEIDVIKNLLSVQKEFPCDEDTEPLKTNVRIDFIRYWYHTRTKVGIMASLEEALETDGGDFYTAEVADTRDRLGQIESKDYCQSFKRLLKKRDLEILELREHGYTFEEIAEKLGYKTHSAVVKRMQAIKEIFLEFQEI